MEKHELQALIEDLHETYLPLSDGNVATYIPELARADPNYFGICMVSSDGRTFATGDCDQPFTIQSISKPFTFGLAIEEFGHDKVFQHVCVEPSGEPFNSIQLESGTNRPHNPMVNSGAITVTSLLHAKHGEDTFEFLRARLSAAAGRTLPMDESVYASESSTGHRKRAIAHLLLNFGMVHDEAEKAVVNRPLGVATYSPPPDAQGNSVRGIRVCSELAARLGLHAFDLMNSGSRFLDMVL